MAYNLGFYGDGISFWVFLSQSFWLRVLPGSAHLVQPRWMPERRILGGDWTGGVSFWPFPNSSGWWRLISSLFLTRTSCRKTTHADGYYGAWPGWEVSISVLPLTLPVWFFAKWMRVQYLIHALGYEICFLVRGKVSDICLLMKEWFGGSVIYNWEYLW